MSETLNDWFNSFIDLSNVVLGRFLELPVLYVTALMLVAVTVVYFAWRLWRRLRGRPQLSWGAYVIALSVASVLGVVLLIDQKINVLQRDIGELKYFVRAEAVRDRAPEKGPATGQPDTGTSAEAAAKKEPKAAPAAAKTGQKPSHRLINETKLQEGLGLIFPEFDIELAVLNRAVEFAAIRAKGLRPCASYISVVDLTDPAIKLVITDEITKKTLTSDFGKKHNCVVAINGEAGTSPSRTARLGRYTGFCVSNGKAVLSKNDYGRPFLTFDRKNRARYVPEDANVPQLTDDMYNVFWGRGDFLTDGKYVRERNPRWSRRDPRTLMGIDAKGTRLILMVVDGRQRGYSEGIDLGTASDILKLFGTHTAMRCDQGGSSAMYLGRIPGIVSRPSDSRGERTTYTHFGIAFKPE